MATFGGYSDKRRSRSNRIAAALRLAGLSAKVDTPARSDASVTLVKDFDAERAGQLAETIRERLGDGAAEVELLVTVTWK
ncbi:hypothetical protein [Amycolatopsis kentuckyensis]|uniref:hypothetical protein n=1 Tax=Amycolatopsis kentuckyensis TaxID=218823 RepID=UPI0035666CC0